MNARKRLARLNFQIVLIPWVTLILIILLFIYGDYVDDSVSWFTVTAQFDSYLSITAEIMSALIGLAIPLALTVIKMVQSRSKTTKLTSLFVSEPIYRAQLVLFLFNITAVVLLSLFQWPYFWIVCLLLFIISMIFLVLFVRLIHKYSANLETYLIERYDNDVSDYFK